jgi:hypothetical protein
MVTGTRVSHHAYGSGTILDIEEIKSGRKIVQVMWDDPSLSQWLEEELRESFWTDFEDLEKKV